LTEKNVEVVSKSASLFSVALCFLWILHCDMRLMLLCKSRVLACFELIKLEVGGSGEVRWYFTQEVIPGH